MKYLLFAVLLALLAGCSGQPIQQSNLSVATHADLRAAAAYAQANGYPARAAVWMAEDAKLGAIETQITACQAAINAAMPKAPATSGAPVTPFLGVEMAAEAVGNFTGIPASVKITCAPFPIVTLPAMPKIP